jgi:hypothetical protein
MMAKTCPIRYGTAAWPALAALALIGLGGCNTSATMMPKTYPVKGTIVYKDGQPLEGGQVEFQPIVKSSVTVTGDIKYDGTFTVRSRNDAATVPGAPSGIYRINILPPATASPTDQAVVDKFTTKRMYFVKQDDNNNFIIGLPWVHPSPQ